MPVRNDLLRQLDERARLARGIKWQRLWFAPVRYLRGQFFQRALYPIHKQGRPVTATTFWRSYMKIILPSAMDIFLLGLKTHPSEIRLSRFLIRQLKPGDNFIDVGAHYGFFSLLAAELVGASGKIWALEASPATFKILQENLQKTPQALAFHQAVSDREGQLDFYEFPTLYAEYNSLHPEQFSDTAWLKTNPAKVHQVPSIRLDNFCKEKTIFPDLIKIDVEGAEAEVVRGMSKLAHILKSRRLLSWNTCLMCVRMTAHRKGR